MLPPSSSDDDSEEDKPAKVEAPKAPAVDKSPKEPKGQNKNAGELPDSGSDEDEDSSSEDEAPMPEYLTAPSQRKKWVQVNMWCRHAYVTDWCYCCHPGSRRRPSSARPKRRRRTWSALRRYGNEGTRCHTSWVPHRRSHRRTTACAARQHHARPDQSGVCTGRTIG
jgi:hypothetical protein